MMSRYNINIFARLSIEGTFLNELLYIKRHKPNALFDETINPHLRYILSHIYDVRGNFERPVYVNDDDDEITENDDTSEGGTVDYVEAHKRRRVREADCSALIEVSVMVDVLHFLLSSY